MKKTFLKLAVLALAGALALTACDFLTGADGPEGIPGTNGLPGGAGVMVYDSSATPKLLGYVLNGGPGSAIILTPTNQVVSVYMTTGKPSETPIFFLTTSAPVNHSTTAYVYLNTAAPANPSYYYNSNSGGLYFKYTGASAISHTIQIGEYYYNFDGASGTYGSTDGPYDFYALTWTTASDYNTGVYGFASVTPPLQYSTAALP